MSRHDNIAQEQSPAGIRSNAEQRLDAALNGLQQGVCMFDADGRIVMFNQRYTDLMGLPAGDLIGMSLLDLFRIRTEAGLIAGDPEKLFAEVTGHARAKSPGA